MYRIIFLQPTDVKGLDPILYPKRDSKTPLIFILPIQEHFLKESLSVFDHLFCFILEDTLSQFCQRGLPKQHASTTPGPLHMLSPKSPWASFLYFSTYLSPILQNSVQFSQQNSLFKPNSPITYHVSFFEVFILGIALQFMWNFDFFPFSQLKCKFHDDMVACHFVLLYFPQV